MLEIGDAADTVMDTVQCQCVADSLAILLEARDDEGLRIGMRRH